MEFEFMTADTVLPPCMPLPTAMLRLPISSTAKIMYARLLDATLAEGGEDTNGILFVRFPIVELAAALSRSSVTVKRSLKELEDAGLILRVRRGVGEPNRIYTLLPKKEGYPFVDLPPGNELLFFIGFSTFRHHDYFIIGNRFWIIFQNIADFWRICPAQIAMFFGFV